MYLEGGELVEEAAALPGVFCGSSPAVLSCFSSWWSWLGTLSDSCPFSLQVAHPLVQKQLVDYIHNGFLVPVMGPALHKVRMSLLSLSKEGRCPLDELPRTVFDSWQQEGRAAFGRAPAALSKGCDEAPRDSATDEPS